VPTFSPPVAVPVAPAVARLTAVTRRYGDVEALRRVDLTLPHGVVGLLGPNGAGKSTLLRLLLGLERADEGQLEVLGQNLADDGPAILARLGYMPEDDSLFPRLSGLDQVLRAAQLSGLPLHDASVRAHRTLDLCGLADVRYRPAEGYSLGMRQRLRLAMAVVHGPELLLLDEPTAGLDPAGRTQMLELIREIAAQGIAVVLSTHVLPDVEAVCDQVVLISSGQVGFCGPLAAFRAGTPTLWRLRLTDDAAPVVAALRAATFVVETAGRDLRLQADRAQLPAVWQLLAASGAGVRHFGPWQEEMGAAFVRHLRLDDPLRRQAMSSTEVR
jgi:ABC-2 type transport system ATP-binding protein